MLSTMTTSENLSLSSSQSRCLSSPYRNVPRSTYGSTMRDGCGSGFLFDSDFPSSIFDGSSDREFGTSFAAPAAGYEKTDGSIGEFEVSSSVGRDPFGPSDGSASGEVPDFEFEPDISELLEQIEIADDAEFDHSKPLNIESNVLKLDFSHLIAPALNSSAGVESPANGSETNCGNSVDDFSAEIAREGKRASRHLSGGGLLSDSSQDVLHCLPDGNSKSRFCLLPDGGCISTENIFDFDDFAYFDIEEDKCKPSNFLSQISPSSPLTFDLAAQKDVKSVTKGNLTDAESTNPFNNFLRNVLDRENVFSPTNPFSSLNFRSSPEQVPNSSPDYANLSVPGKSFSQCSTRPASPVQKNSPEEPLLSNPFLLNRDSPQSCVPVNAGQFFLNDGRFPKSRKSLPMPNPSSSIIFAVPVFPIFQHHIANSSTQTSEQPIERIPSAQEPVYENVTSQLRKFMQWNNHSEYDLQCLKTTMKDLRNSGWYYENVSWKESVVLLKDTEPGTFLIRDSSDPNFLFSLSVQTSRGPTSVRLHYVNGQFRLDAEEKLVPHMPSFNSVIELIDYYIENTVKNKFTNSLVKKNLRKNGKDKLQKSKEQVWIDAQGNVYSNILLVKPLYKKEHFSTLQHLTRLAINRRIKKNLNARCEISFRVTPVYESSPFQESSFPISFDNFCPILNVDTLPLPQTLLNYLKDYPYCH